MALPVTGETMRRQAGSAPPGAVDPNVKIPAHVLKSGQRAEAIQKALAGEVEPSVAATVVEGQAAAPVVATPSNGQPQPAVPIQEPPPPQEPLPQEPPQEPPNDGRPVDWERLYKSHTGRIEAEQKRAREQLAQMSERMEQIMRENQTLRAGAAATPPNPATPPQSLLTEQEVADYGPEFVDVMRRVAAETAEPLHAEIQSLRGQLGHVQQETGNAFLTRMNATIAGHVPNWQVLNKDPRFIEWTQLPDIFSGAIRKSLMQEAWNSGDANRVIAFFHAYLAEEAATDPQRANGAQRPGSRMVVTPASAVTPPALVPPAFTLDTLAAPGRAHSAGGSPAEKPVYSSADITRFYTDVAAGRWRGREQQQAAIDADIILAQHEGRILPDNRNQLPRDPYQR